MTSGKFAKVGFLIPRELGEIAKQAQHFPFLFDMIPRKLLFKYKKEVKRANVSRREWGGSICAVPI